MINIIWDNKYSVGYEYIDNEHRVFIDLIRASSKAIDANMDIDRVSRHLQELMLYAKFHFFAEENLMINSKYPQYQSHKEAHTQLIDSLEEKVAAYRSNPEDGEPLIEFIFEWFILHTMKIDKELANYLNAYDAGIAG